MKKIFLIFILFFMANSVFAINWIDLKSANGNIVSLDIDSIKEDKNYYFYNIKMNTTPTESIVITMQSAKLTPFCARIKYYKPSQYEKLNGDYENITLNKTTKLEPVTYESRAYAAYKKVKEIIKDKNKTQNTGIYI